MRAVRLAGRNTPDTALLRGSDESLFLGQELLHFCLNDMWQVVGTADVEPLSYPLSSRISASPFERMGRWIWAYVGKL
jgi:hypothetical protein